MKNKNLLDDRQAQSGTLRRPAEIAAGLIVSVPDRREIFLSDSLSPVDDFTPDGILLFCDAHGDLPVLRGIADRIADEIGENLVNFLFVSGDCGIAL